MAATVTPAPGSRGVKRESGYVGARQNRLASLIETDRPEILASYGRRLAGPGLQDSVARNRMVDICAQILADTVRSVRAGHIGIDRSSAREGGQALAWAEIHPRDILQAAETLFSVVVSSIMRSVAAEPELLPESQIAIVALNDSISMRIREKAVAYSGYLLDRVHRAHVDERSRIARDLHDRLGEKLWTAHRQIELQVPHSAEEKARITVADQAIVGVMDMLRLIIAGLQQEPVRCLRQALAHYVGSVQGHQAVSLNLSVRGDESRVSAMVLDESFLILREAAQNALKHGNPTVVLIRVELACHELRASVEDDGDGFDVAGIADFVPAGMGITSMRDRATLLGGTLTLSSQPGPGTQVDLQLPLQERGDE